MIIIFIGFIALFSVIFVVKFLAHIHNYKKELKNYSGDQLDYILWFHNGSIEYKGLSRIKAIVDSIPYKKFKSHYYPQNPIEVGCDEYIKLCDKKKYRWNWERDRTHFNFDLDFCLYIAWVHTLYVDSDFIIKLKTEGKHGELLGNMLPDIFLKKDYYPEYPNDTPKEFKDWKDSLSLQK